MSDELQIAWIPYIQEWREVYKCKHGFYYCLDPGDGLPTHIEEGDGIQILTTTEADCTQTMNEFEATLPEEQP